VTRGKQLEYLPAEVLDKLRAAVLDGSKVRHYIEGRQPERASLGLRQSRYEASRPEPPELIVETPSGLKVMPDADASILVHRWIGALPRDVATDERLWVALSHGILFKYCALRWRLPEDTAKARSRITERWFVGGKAGLRRHAIGRLWWGAELTVSPWKRDVRLTDWATADEYAMTKVLFRLQDAYQGLIERRMGWGELTRTTVLKAIAEIEQRALSAVDSAFCKRLLKQVNLLALHTELEALEPTDALARVRQVAEACIEGRGR